MSFRLFSMAITWLLERFRSVNPTLRRLSIMSITNQPIWNKQDDISGRVSRIVSGDMSWRLMNDMRGIERPTRWASSFFAASFQGLCGPGWVNCWPLRAGKQAMDTRGRVTFRAKAVKLNRSRWRLELFVCELEACCSSQASYLRFGRSKNSFLTRARGTRRSKLTSSAGPSECDNSFQLSFPAFTRSMAFMRDEPAIRPESAITGDFLGLTPSCNSGAICEYAVRP